MRLSSGSAVTTLRTLRGTIMRAAWATTRITTCTRSFRHAKSRRRNLGHLPDNRRGDQEFGAPMDSPIPNGGLAALRVRERGDVDIRIEDGFKLKFRGAQVHTINPTATINKGTFDALRIAGVIQEDDRQDHAAAPTGPRTELRQWPSAYYVLVPGHLSGR